MILFKMLLFTSGVLYGAKVAQSLLKQWITHGGDTKQLVGGADWKHA